MQHNLSNEFSDSYIAVQEISENQEDTTLARPLQNSAMIIVKLERKEILRQSRREYHIDPCRELAYAQCACVFSIGKMADPMYGHQGRERSILVTEQVQRKRHKFLTSVAR